MVVNRDHSRCQRQRQRGIYGHETHRLIEQHEIHLWAVGAHERACDRYALPLRNTLRKRVPGQGQKG